MGMMIGRSLTLVALLGTTLIGTLVDARDWRLSKESSAINFEYQRAGNPAEGRFRAFEAEGHFDEAAPENAALTMRIDTKSIDLYDPIVSAFATSAEWFDSKNHRDARYELLSLKPIGGNSYAAIGNLTIRGETRKVSSTIDLEVEDGEASVSGSLEIMRRDFGLGVGLFSAFDQVGDRVAIRFDLNASGR